MKSNPYNYHMPVKPTRFVGRWDDVKRISRNLLNSNGDSYVVIAGRRCGKSSFLEATSNELLDQSNCYGNWRGLPVILDLKCDNFQSAGMIFARLLNEIYSKVNINEEWRTTEAWYQLIDLEVNWLKNLLLKSDIKLTEFEKAISFILAKLDQTAPAYSPVRIVFLVDEIDEVLGLGWTESLLNQMRALVSSGPIRDRVRWVLTGSHLLLQSVQFKGSSLWNMLEKHFLLAFETKGIDELISYSGELLPRTRDTLIKMSGKHPYLAQYLLYHIWEKGFEKVSEKDVYEMADLFLIQEMGTLNGWTNALGPNAINIYQVLGNLEVAVGESELIAFLDEVGDEVKTSLLALSCHGLVSNNGWKTYQCSCGIFTAWLNKLGREFCI